MAGPSKVNRNGASYENNWVRVRAGTDDRRSGSAALAPAKPGAQRQYKPNM